MNSQGWISIGLSGAALVFSLAAICMATFTGRASQYVAVRDGLTEQQQATSTMKNSLNQLWDASGNSQNDLSAVQSGLSELEEKLGTVEREVDEASESASSALAKIASLNERTTATKKAYSPAESSGLGSGTTADGLDWKIAFLESGSTDTDKNSQPFHISQPAVFFVGAKNRSEFGRASVSVSAISSEEFISGSVYASDFETEGDVFGCKVSYSGGTGQAYANFDSHDCDWLVSIVIVNRIPSATELRTIGKEVLRKANWNTLPLEL